MYLIFVLSCIFTFVPSYPMYLLCLFSDFHSFNYHNYSHPTSLAFSYFGCPTTVCTVYLFSYNYFLVNSSSCLHTVVENKLLYPEIKVQSF